MASEVFSFDTDALENLKNKYFSCYDKMTRVVTALNKASSDLATLEGIEFNLYKEKFNNLYKSSDELLESITNIRDYIDVVINNTKATEAQIEAKLNEIMSKTFSVNTEIDRKW